VRNAINAKNADGSRSGRYATTNAETLLYLHQLCSLRLLRRPTYFLHALRAFHWM